MSSLVVLDFYDPLRNTEVSIKRARKAYPSYPDTQQIQTNQLPLDDHSADKIFVILSAHEIRSDEERAVFFKELGRALKPSGEIIVIEHLRNLANLMAYNIGYLHFFSKNTWHQTFSNAGLTVRQESKWTPFVSNFILSKDGNSL